MLDRNLLVEAAAGTGKTTCLVDRMIALLAGGRCADIHQMAAVTFTRKAAAELRSRFRQELEKAVAATDRADKEKQNLGRALEHLDQCFIGTIHSFCGRLLRERPVEAGVDMDFAELEEDADWRLREEAWKRYCAELIAEDPEGILAELDRLGLQVDGLKDSFKNFAEYPDVEEWPSAGPGASEADFSDPIRRIRDYGRHMQSLWPQLPAEWGSDTLIPLYKKLPRIILRSEPLEEIPQLLQVLDYFNQSVTVRTTLWSKAGGSLTADEASAEEKKWNDFRSQVVEPVFRRIYELRYPLALRLMRGAGAVYDRLRVQSGRLNYQDLLLKARDLLRGRPNVRRYFQRRFTHLLVDEFQDTDPIQAEVMFLLTAEDAGETDWRQCRPRPGSLFVVGDPKQSIYRFRRADIVTYNQAKEIIQATGGRVVKLSANFRSDPPLINWVNEVFAPQPAKAADTSDRWLRFPAAASEHSPEYVPLQPGRDQESSAGRAISGVLTLTIPAEYSSNKETAAQYEAARIARFIRHLLDSHPQITPVDFLIITRNTFQLTRYAQALQKQGVPHQVTGGAALNEVEELRWLYLCLRAVVNPEDPVALVAALRSELFGISDAQLYAFKKAGGKFSFQSRVPDGLAPELDESFSDAYRRLRKYFRWLSLLPALTALERIGADLGLMVSAALSDGGEIQAGGLAKALEILRRVQAEMWSAAQLVEYLGRLVQKEEKYDGLSVRSADPPRVRVMNLHKAKGLEATFVFLADTSGETEHPPRLHIDRSGGTVRGYLLFQKEIQKAWGKQYEDLALPPDWEKRECREKEFQQAEELRLRYVAATRARTALIISRREAKDESNPWRPFAPFLEAAGELPDPGEVSAPTRPQVEISAVMVKEAEAELRARREQSAQPTYAAWRAKEYALATAPRPGVELPSLSPHALEGEHGVEWGQVLHQLLQLKMNQPEADLTRRARELLREHELAEERVGDAVRMVEGVLGSEIWARARQSSRRLTEAPFVLCLEQEGRPLLLRGAIDLVFEEDDGWVLVDYKSDQVNGKRLADLVAHYAPQVRLYAEAWEKCTGAKVKAAGLYFLAAPRWMPLPGANAPA